MKISDLHNCGWRPLTVGAGAKAFYSVVAPAENTVNVPELLVVTAGQIHSANVRWVSGECAEVADTDALITNSEGLALSVRTADCVPIIINASDIGIIAAVHAGWRGTLAGIVAKTLKELKQAGAAVEQIYAAIGPHICTDCYEVSPELGTEFQKAGYGDYVITAEGKRPHLDLEGINLCQLIGEGVPKGNITSSGLCTLCTPGDIFPSYRRNATSQRLYTVIFRD